MTAETEWPRLVDIFAEDTDLVVSNSGDEGYRLSERDGEVAGDGLRAPVSFPAKLASLLIARWRRTARGLSIFPCELVNRNGDALRAVVEEAAIRCGAPPAFRKWLSSDVRFVNTLVDRIVSEPIEPAGAVAEPYALWAIEGMQAGDAPFEHLAVVVTPDLERYERLKLHILNLGHTVLADRWLAGGAAAMTVGEAVADPAYRAYLDLVFEQEVLPGFAARGLEVEARDYMRTTMERFANPFLKHRLADIAQNHSMKVVRRIGGFRDWATSAGHAVEMRRLDEICERSASRR
ncbi:mannitol dehydrogenase family protein [Aquamicrobium sp. LC103]|uniref:mannitol dehydrogenase family protein n=1 Tax=Aquamicrobium sp. LC103 TaxID=1120658 RepID=UPI0032B2D275